LAFHLCALCVTPCAGSIASPRNDRPCTLLPGASSAALVKHLEVQGYCLAELAMRHKQPDPPSLRSNQDIASSNASGQIGGVTGIPGQPVQAPMQTQSRGGVTGVPPLMHARGLALHSTLGFRFTAGIPRLGNIAVSICLLCRQRRLMHIWGLGESYEEEHAYCRDAGTAGSRLSTGRGPQQF
jgi:hypothetical protein